MRKKYNREWQFTPDFSREFLEGKVKGETVTLPHTCKVTPYHYWGPELYEMVSGYRKTFVPEERWQGKKIFIHFDGAAHGATVYFNGNEIGYHGNGYTGFTFELTEGILPQQENVIVVALDSREQQNIPPFGYVIDYMTYGGIYRDVWLEVKDTSYLEDVFFKADHKGKYTCQIQIKNPQEHMELHIGIEDEKGSLTETVYRNLDQDMEICGQLTGIIPWSVDNPKLYQLRVRLESHGYVLDEYRHGVGFRSLKFVGDGCYLNESLLKIRGLNRHQSFPYVGYAMPKSMQVLDAKILKEELGVNMVRTSHYPQSHDFLNACDELGLLVFTEIPGWQHIGDEDWKKQALENVREMIIQYRNHCSIALWGVRINESLDDNEFYRQTNELARQLDSTRATTGVRFIEKSNLLEDVYAFNDFSHTGKNPGLKAKKTVTSDLDKGYLVSECNGHMFPTKSFDDEEHRLSHALRHCSVLESAYKSPEITGVLSWCMFDYHTHKDFGSGDGICYHGVMDMFRNPKLAAAVYASQQDQIPICQVSSSMDIGEHPAGNLGDVYVFTNGDSVRFYKNDTFVKEFFPDAKYGHMPHPPVKIDDMVGELLANQESYSPRLANQIKDCLLAVGKYGQGNLPLKYILKFAYLMVFRHISFSEGVRLFGKYIGNWGGEAPTYRFDVIRKQQVIQSITKQQGSVIHLWAQADHQKLEREDSYDVALVRLRALDAHNNPAVYFQEPLVLKAEGGIDIIGPTIISLKGGMGGTFVRTRDTGEAGVLTIESDVLGSVMLHFTII